MQITVFGAGSIGSLLGGLLAREHEVTLVGREPHVTAIRENGLELAGALDAVVHPHASTAIAPDDSPDLAVVTVKAYDTGTAASELARAEPDRVLSLQNGMGNEAILAEQHPGRVLAGTTTYGARLVDPGLVACTGIGRVTLGPHESAPGEAAASAGQAFEQAGIDTEVLDDVRDHLWKKLAVNAGINPVTALARIQNGALLEGPASELARQAAEETAAVARAHGVELSDDRATEALREVARTTAENRSSMLVDVERGRRTEIDAIGGYVLAQASRAVPVTETLVGLLRSWEQSQGLR